MILIPRWVAILLLVIAVGSIVALGIAGYKHIGSSRVETQAVVKGDAETFLYAAIVAAGVLTASLIVLAGRTEYISRELDKMVTLNRHGDFSPEISMKKLGRIGEKITLLYFTLNALNEKRSLKISALSDLVQILANNVNAPILITDVTGAVIYANKRIAERLELHRSELINKNVNDLITGTSFQDVIAQLDRSNASYEFESGGVPTVVVPVDNRMNELSYVIWSFGRYAFSTDGT